MLKSCQTLLFSYYNKNTFEPFEWLIAGQVLDKHASVSVPKMSEILLKKSTAWTAIHSYLSSPGGTTTISDIHSCSPSVACAFSKSNPRFESLVNFLCGLKVLSGLKMSIRPCIFTA